MLRQRYGAGRSLRGARHGDSHAAVRLRRPVSRTRQPPAPVHADMDSTRFGNFIQLEMTFLVYF